MTSLADLPFYTPDPPRGCGQKKDNAFYLEGVASPAGTLHLWTHVLGDGVDDNTFPINLPPRQMSFLNVAATLTEFDLIWAGDKYEPDIFHDDLYTTMTGKVREVGLGDHVGQMYSAKSFADEIYMYGPSRRTTAEIAKSVSILVHRYGALPILFSHKRIPVWRSATERRMAMELCNDALSENIDWDGREIGATWMAEDWGMYRKHKTGNNHYMIPILSVISALDKRDKGRRKTDTEAWQRVAQFFDGVQFVEQTFGASWINQVTYTVPEDGKVDEKTLEYLKNMPGVNYLDLHLDKDGAE